MKKISKPIQNLDAALKAYYGNGYIDNALIKEMFGKISSSTIAKLKRLAREEEINQNVPIVIPYHVNAKIAFEAWGIDIKELERNRKKLLELELYENAR